MKGSLRSSTELRVVVGVIALAVVGTVTVALISGDEDGQAFADTARSSVRIQDVKPNVIIPPRLANASTRVFTVDCGTNQNRKFSPDNPVAQPGIKNGAEHLHDFVGNLSTSADSTDESLDAAGTTCTDGDKSAYFWPVVRIDTAQAPTRGGSAGPPTISCPAVRDKLPAVPDEAMASVNENLAQLDRQIADASQRLAAANGRGGPNFNNDSILGPLRDKRAATLSRIANAIGRGADRPRGLVGLAECEFSYDGRHGEHAGGSGNTATPTVNCPTVRDKLPGIPAQALASVNENLAQLDKQIAAANERLVSWHGQGGTPWANTNILGPLRQKRSATLNAIINTIDRFGPRPTGLGGLASCTIGKAPTAPTTAPPSTPTPSTPSTTDPSPTTAPTTAPTAAPTAGPTVPPRVLPVPEGANLELPNNTGVIQRPVSVKIEYRGNPTSKVVAMPKFLRALTGDAKPTSRGPANARSSWTCTGFNDRIIDKYPICPANSKVQRINDFPSCWDGVNTDSANHRTHIVFPNASTGACPAGFKAVPQVRITLTYNIPPDIQRRGLYFLDSFPEENHNPFSDHNDFINVNSDTQMAQIATCVNTGRGCS